MGQAHGFGDVLCRQAARQHPGAQPAAPGDQTPIKGQAVATRQHAVPGRFGVDQDLVGHGAEIEQGGQITLIRHADRLHHRQAIARAHLCHALGAFMAVQLQHVERHGFGDGIQRRVIGIDGQRDLGQTGRCGQRQIARLIQRQVARAFGEEHQPHIGRPGIRHRLHIGQRAQPADLDLHPVHQRALGRSSSASTSSAGSDV